MQAAGCWLLHSFTVKIRLSVRGCESASVGVLRRTKWLGNNSADCGENKSEGSVANCQAVLMAQLQTSECELGVTPLSLEESVWHREGQVELIRGGFCPGDRGTPGLAIFANEPLCG